MSAFDHVCKRNGGPAFPHEYANGPMGEGSVVVHGLTIRDYFAAKAMQGLSAKGVYMQPEYTCKIAYEMADAMLAERDKP